MSSWRDWRYCSCLGPCFIYCLKPCFSSLSDEYSSRDCKSLDFSHCNLKEVPDEIFSVERTLEELILDANSIRDLPRVVFHCTGLRKLSLADNDIETLPNAISSLVYLEYLNLSRNSLLIIPDGIKCCKCLTVLDCSVNPLGKLPDSFTQLINLQELYLNDTFLEYLPANFGRLSRLKIVELRENSIKILPKSISRLVNLERLDIGQNELVEFSEVLCSLPNLAELWIDGNRISTLPEAIGNLTKLTYLDASENRITTIESQLGNCQALTDLLLSCNKIIQLPETLGSLKNLVYLRLDDNELNSLPQSVGGLSSLQEFVISNNNISSLPKNIGFLRNLHTLIMDCNQLTDLPDTICSCSKLRLLSIASNKLTELPEDIGRLTNLRVLNLRNNQLKYLPYSFANITQLQTLWLSDNQQKPIMKLQTDSDEKTGKKLLTCFLLPQQPSFNFDEVCTSDHDDQPKEERNSNQDAKIKFCSINGEVEEKEDQFTSKLIRNPTPYPKELKSHARHARNLALKRRDSFGNGEGDDDPSIKNKDPFSIGATSTENQYKSSHMEIKEAKLVPKTKVDSAEYDDGLITRSDLTMMQSNSLLPSTVVITRKQSVANAVSNGQNVIGCSPIGNKTNLQHLINDDRGYRSDQENWRDIAGKNENIYAGYSSDIDNRGNSGPFRRLSQQHSSPTSSLQSKNDPLIGSNTVNHSAIKNLTSHQLSNDGSNVANQTRISNLLGSTSKTATMTTRSQFFNENLSLEQQRNSHLPTTMSNNATNYSTKNNLFTSQLHRYSSSIQPPSYTSTAANLLSTQSQSKLVNDTLWQESKSSTEFTSPSYPAARPRYISAPSQVIFQQFSMGGDHLSSPDYGANSIYQNSSSHSNPQQTTIHSFNNSRCDASFSDYESVQKSPQSSDSLLVDSNGS